ncbi:MAG: hypothetical protein PWQ51_2255 [Methanolobus sp.]|jgi:hypothetical protein|uniref:Uncharacterized protein n=2 Tax=Methanolobus TaxID=2220 RepID=W9DTJ3_METTI|nr:hypothetical protein [Methanolobus tindarius]ETA67002.1 hypothetical protein MettiDRAFT_0407 [Methanolobus tindarius DSM 2278]MDI3485821.1 hypothetical protein [Methanolobus sp.]MDK2832133.1 hypothetical protein [Methanolobus sp.]MDK2940090.1 hypothetical protein [Methanolobus sp.]
MDVNTLHSVGMNLLYDVRDWFYECDRFLFLAEVHYQRENVNPSEHRFNEELTSSRLDAILCNLKNLSKENDYCVDSNECVSKDEILMLKKTLDNISSGNWNDMDAECVAKSKAIVHKLAKAVNADIIKTNDMRGCPSIYDACRII